MKFDDIFKVCYRNSEHARQSIKTLNNRRLRSEGKRHRGVKTKRNEARAKIRAKKSNDKVLAKLTSLGISVPALN